MPLRLFEEDLSGSGIYAARVPGSNSENAIVKQQTPVPSAVVHTLAEKRFIDDSKPWLFPCEIQPEEVVL